MIRKKKISFLILSGPTREYIDPVRFISNESSGKMGKALAETAQKKGEVVFISGQVDILPKGVKIINVVTAKEMFKMAKKYFKKSDIIINAAAVADFVPLKIFKQKIKKEYLTSNSLTVKLKKNIDILSYFGKNKKKQVVAGFALETNNFESNALEKFKKKNLDLITVNGKNSLGSDKTSVCIITESDRIKIDNKSKSFVSRIIINEAIRIFSNIEAGERSIERSIG
jgi:phosphopantothenoylcysteine synthetase/decarboxylase